ARDRTIARYDVAPRDQTVRHRRGTVPIDPVLPQPFVMTGGGGGALPLPTKQPAKLNDATTKASANATFFTASPPFCWLQRMFTITDWIVRALVRKRHTLIKFARYPPLSELPRGTTTRMCPNSLASTRPPSPKWSRSA